MNRHNLVAILVSCAMLVNGLALPALAADGPATFTDLEEATYAQREAESSHVETFAGGSSGLEIVVIVVVVAAVVYLIWYFVQNEYGQAMATPEETEDVMLGAISPGPDSSLDHRGR